MEDILVIKSFCFLLSLDSKPGDFKLRQSAFINILCEYLWWVYCLCNELEDGTEVTSYGHPLY